MLLGTWCPSLLLECSLRKDGTAKTLHFVLQNFTHICKPESSSFKVLHSCFGSQRLASKLPFSKLDSPLLIRRFHSQPDSLSSTYSEQSSLMCCDLCLRSNAFYISVYYWHWIRQSIFTPTLWPLPPLILSLKLLCLKTTLDFLSQKRVWQIKWHLVKSVYTKSLAKMYPGSVSSAHCGHALRCCKSFFSCSYHFALWNIEQPGLLDGLCIFLFPQKVKYPFTL